MARLWTLDGTVAREVLVVSGHSASLQRVRFHPHEPSWLCTAASDSTVRLWDCRLATQKSLGRIGLSSSAADVAWCNSHGSSSIFAVTENDGSVHVYDMRKLSGSSSSGGPLYSYTLKPSLVETCIFSPASHHLVAATTSQDDNSEICIWKWKQENNGGSSSSLTTPDTISYPAHTGPIYSLAFSPDGNRLATGGSDAIVGVWDAKHLVCTHTISRNTKFTRSVSFSHDSKLLASSAEEGGIDVALAETGELVGKVELSRPKGGGADEIAFHPKSHLLACARCGTQGNSPVTVAKLSLVTS